MGEGVEAGRDADVDRQRRGERGVVHDRAGQHPRVAAGALVRPLGEPPHVGGLRAGVRRRHGDHGQSAGEGDRLGQPGRRAAADAHDHVRLVLRGRGTGTLRDGHRHMHRDLVVEQYDGQPRRHPGRDRRLRGGGDHHHPAGAEQVGLGRQGLGGAAGGEDDPLAQRLVGEAQAHAAPSRPSTCASAACSTARGSSGRVCARHATCLSGRTSSAPLSSTSRSADHV